MSMSLRMSLGQSQRQTQEQRLSMAQQISLLQTTLQQMTQTISMLRGSQPDSFEACVPSVLQYVLDLATDQLRDREVAVGLQQLFSTGSFQLAMANQVANLAPANRQAVRSFSLHLIESSLSRDSANRIIIPKSLDPDKQSALNTEATTVKQLRDAFENPAKLRTTLAKQTELARSGAGSGAGAMQDISEMRVALDALQLLGRHYEVFAKLVQISLELRCPAGEAILRSFLRDRVVLSKLDYAISLRIQRRFARIFSRVGKRARSKNYRDAMLNSIAEFVLVSLGIIAPEIFGLHTKELQEVDYLFSQQMYDDDEENEGKDGPIGEFGLDNWMTRYYLKKKGRLFWNRWAIIGQKPTRVTDERIRLFIRETVAKRTDQLLQAIEFEKVFSRCQEVNLEAREADDDDDDATATLLGEVLADALEKAQFRQVLESQMRGDWYQKLSVFWSEQEN